MHDYFKMIYGYVYEDKRISMSDCTVTQSRDKINILIDFALNHDISLTDLGVNRTDDINRYLYGCICDKKADVHHDEAIGIGRNRRKINHVGMKAIALCIEHHRIVEQEGSPKIYEEHKAYPIKLDEICS